MGIAVFWYGQVILYKMSLEYFMEKKGKTNILLNNFSN